jgi:putative bacteriocin precursor
MKKLFKRNSVVDDTIEAFTCNCGCTCGCSCTYTCTQAGETYISAKSDINMSDSSDTRYSEKVGLLSLE